MDRKRLVKFLSRYWFFLVLALVFFLRLPSLFEPFTYGDEGVYLTLGQALRKGLVFYRDIHDNKPPLLYLLAALADSFAYFRLMLFIWSLITIFVFSKLALLLFPKNKPAVITTTTLFAVLISLHTFEGNVANAENFMMLPTIAGFYLFFKNRAKKILWIWPVIGTFFALAALFKIPAAFDFAALLFLIILINPKIKITILTQQFLLLAIGFFTPILLSFLYYQTKGALAQYLTAAFSQNLPYLASWAPDKPQALGLPWPLLTRTSILLAIIVFLWCRRDKISSEVKLIILWFGFGLFASLLSSRPYPHYLLQAIPPLSLSFGFVFNKNKQKIIPLALTFVLIAAFLIFKFWHYPNLSYYHNFYQFLFKAKSQEEYFAYFGDHANNLYRVAEFLKTRNQTHEKIFAWGNHPSIYALTRRLPVGRYVVAYHIIDFNGYQETMTALAQNPPRYIIVDQEEKRPFPELKSFIQEKYVFELQTGDFQIFHRILQ